MKINELFQRQINEQLLLENYNVLRDVVEDNYIYPKIMSKNRFIKVLKAAQRNISTQIDDFVDAYEVIVKKNIPVDEDLASMYPRWKDAGYWIREIKRNPDNIFNFIEVTGSAVEEVEQRRLQKNYESDYDVIFKSQNVVVFRPNTTAASCKLGRGTKWCTAAKNDNAFDNYKDMGDLYYFHTRRSSPYDKLAAFVYNGRPVVEYFDSSDRPLSVVEFKEQLTPLLEDREMEKIEQATKIPLASSVDVKKEIMEAISNSRSIFTALDKIVKVTNNLTYREIGDIINDLDVDYGLDRFATNIYNRLDEVANLVNIEQYGSGSKRQMQTLFMNNPVEFLSTIIFMYGNIVSP